MFEKFASWVQFCHAAFLAARRLVAIAICCFLFPLIVVFTTSFVMSEPLLAKVIVSHEAREEKGFARLVLDFDHLPVYESRVDDTVLVFKFSEAVELDFTQLVAQLPNYLGVARVDPDGRAFRIAFIDNFKVNIMEAGNKVFIDILGRNWVGMPPNLPQDVVREITKRAAEIEAENRERQLQQAKSKVVYKAKIRVGALPTFSRLVFDWNKFVTAKMERQDQIVTLTFGQPVKLDVGRVKHNLPKHLLDISEKQLETETLVKLKLSPRAVVRGYREADDYVVDISPTEVELSKQLKQLQKKILDDEGVEVGRAEVMLFDDGAKPKKMDEYSGAEDSIKLVRSTYSAFNPDEYDLKVFGDTGDASGHNLSPVKPYQYDGSRRQNFVDGKSGHPQNSGFDQRVDDLLRPSLREMVDHSEIYFPFHEVVPAAGFIRGDTVWIVFDTFKELDLSQLMTTKSKYIQRIRKLRLHNGQLLLIKLTEPKLFALEYKNLVWTAKIGDMVTAKAEALRLRRKVSGDNQRYVSISVERPSHVYWLRDDEIGDRIGIVTSFPPVGQLIKPQNFVEFSSFGTGHGIVITPKTDDVEIRVGFQEVVIRRNHGLHLSDQSDHEQQMRQVPKKKNADVTDVGLIKFAEWRDAGNGSFANKMGGFESRIALAEKEEKFQARRDYSRYLLANELALETLGMLQRIMTETPEKQNDPELRVMQAAANVMMHRPKDAVKSLSIGALYNNEHAALWRGMAKLMLEEWSDALRQFKGGADALLSYPQKQRSQFLLGAAKSAMALRNYALMNQYLRSVSGDTGEPNIDIQLMLLNAKYLVAMGNEKEAERLYNIVANSDVAPLVARAKVDLLNLNLESKKIVADDAITQLEGMQLMWRGDSTELEMLSLLSKLYAEKGDYRLAFSNMKQAVKAFPEHNDALQIQDDMSKVFKSLFLQNELSQMRPIEALSLFYDYKELTPIGRTGDEMIRMLADRLIDVDLLDHAAELLDHQVNNRVRGAGRSQVAAKLAMVYLMNRKPALALQTIGRTRQPNLPKKIKRARDILEARSLSELGQVDGAIDILNRRQGSEIDRMKADAYWNAQQWSKAGEQLEKILGASWNSALALQPFERQDVLRSAISYSLAQDAFALSRLRKKFYNKMVNSPDASPFIAVTKPVKKDGEAYKKLAKDIAAINTLDTFMKQYYDYYKDSLSEQEAGAEEETSAEDASSGPSEREG